jgi:hypothetical protein
MPDMKAHFMPRKPACVFQCLENCAQDFQTLETPAVPSGGPAKLFPKTGMPSALYLKGLEHNGGLLPALGKYIVFRIMALIMLMVRVKRE